MFETVVCQSKQNLQFICFSQNQYVSLHSSYVAYLNVTELLLAKLLYQTWTSVLLLFKYNELKVCLGSAFFASLALRSQKA